MVDARAGAADLDMRETSPRELNVVVVGAGFGGLYALYKFRSLGLSVQVYEAGHGIGGTWFWNR